MKTKDLKKKSAKPAEGTKKTVAKKAASKKIAKTPEGKTKKTATKSPIKAASKARKIEKKRLSTKTVAEIKTTSPATKGAKQGTSGMVQKAAKTPLKKKPAKTVQKPTAAKTPKPTKKTVNAITKAVPKKKAVTGKPKIEAKTKAKAKPKAAVAKVSIVKPKPAVKPEKKAPKKKAVIAKARVKAKPKAIVSKVSAVKLTPAVKTPKKKVVTSMAKGKAKSKTAVKVAVRPKVKVKPKAKVTAIKPKPLEKIERKTPKKKAVTAKAKAKPKAIVSKVAVIKPRPIQKIEKKTAKSATEINVPNKSVKTAAMPQIETKSGIKETPAKAGTKRTLAVSRPKISGTAVMGRISIAPKKEISVPASPSFTISSAGEKTVKKDMVTQEAERIPLKSHKARLKIFLPNQDLTKEEAEEIFLGGLPEEYGENSVIALAVDPNIVFVDWEVIPGDIANMEGDLNLRFYDVTGIEFNDWNANAVIDVLINKRVGSGFFDIRMPGSDVVVAVGILNAVSGFMTIVRSDAVSFPALLTFDELGIVQKLFESGSPVGY